MTAKTKILRLLVAVIAALWCSVNVFAQTGEHVVILWDVTGSLLSPKPSKGLGGNPLPAYSKGNGMWVDLQKAVIDCIQFTDTDPGNEITVVTFHDNIRDVFTRKATDAGKDELVDIVKNYAYVSHNYTNIVDPLNKFYSLLNRNKINYMFLFTDGDNDHPGTRPRFIPTLNSWENKTGAYDAYGFYVLVHPDAATPEIKASVESQENFWIVSDAKVRIKICTLPSSLKYNVRDDKGPKTISMSGKYASAAGDVTLTSNDQYYDVICTGTDIKDGKLSFEVKPKAGACPPTNHTVSLRPVLSGADQYTFVGPNQINLQVSNVPERSLEVTVENNKLGKASYYDAFLFVPAKSTPLRSVFKVDFSEQAKVEGSSATMAVYLVDRKGENRVSPSKLGLSLLINGVESESIILTPDMSEVVIEIVGQPDTKDGIYYGRIQLTPSRLDNCTINNSEDIFKWKFDFDQKLNPLMLALLILLVIFVTVSVFFKFVFYPLRYPRFGSIQKSFNIPGMAPLIVKFKGARGVVVSAMPVKKQSGWNRFWTGKVIYKIHPAFVTPIEFLPSRGKRVLVKTQAGAYRVNPNPMPGIGAATIIDVKKNLKINVN